MIDPVKLFKLVMRAESTLDWMTTDMKWRYDPDQTGIEQNYSPELKEAMKLLDEIRAAVKEVGQDFEKERGRLNDRNPG